MSGNTKAGGGGARGLLSAALWAAGSVGLVTVVMMWAFDLGTRNPADIPALSAEAPWRQAPERAEGRLIPGGDKEVYGALSEGRDAAASAVASALGAPPAERPTEADLLAAAEAPPPLAEIAPNVGAEVSREDFEKMAMAAAAEAAAGGRRTILLDDPVEPLRTVSDYQAPSAPVAPPNVGAGAETPPPNAVFYQPNAAVGDARVPPPADGAAQEDGAGAAADGPPEAISAAVDEGTVAEEDDPPPAATEIVKETPPEDASRLAEAAAQAAPSLSGAGQPTGPAREPRSAAPEAAAAAPEGARPDPGAGDRSRQASAAVARAPLATAPPAPAIYQIQLGALDSVRAVESEWNALKQRAPALLGAYELDVQPVNVGGARLYRLRVGAFPSRSEAARLCAQLRAQEIECFPASG